MRDLWGGRTEGAGRCTNPTGSGIPGQSPLEPKEYLQAGRRGTEAGAHAPGCRPTCARALLSPPVAPVAGGACDVRLVLPETAETLESTEGLSLVGAPESRVRGA